MGILGRLAHFIAALVQGAVFAALTLGFGGLVGMVVGSLAQHVRQGGLIGLGVGALLVIVGFAPAVSQPVNPATFLDWWFRAVCLAETGLGMAVASYFLQLRLGVRLGLHWPAGALQLASGALAVWLWLPTSFALLGILFPPHGVCLEERPLSGGLVPFTTILARARRLGDARHKADSGRQP